MTAPLEVTERDGDGVREGRFALVVDGERVPGIVVRPDADGPMPLVVLQHPGTDSKDGPFVTGLARAWAREGWTCAGIDAPLHGERDEVDPMRLFAGRTRLDPEVQDRFATEVSATVDALAATYPLDLGRIGFCGFSLGSMLGVHALARDGRFRAAALCLLGEGLMGPATGPDSVVPALSGVAIRLVAKEHDELIAAASTQALYDALPGEKDLVWLGGGHFQIGPDVIAAAHAWLATHL